MQSHKQQNDLCSFPRQTIQYHSNPTLCSSNAEKAEVEKFYEDLQDLLELTPKKDVFFFIIGDWNAKGGSQEMPGITGKFGLGVQNEARECTGHSKHSLPTTKRRLYTWTSPDGQR